MPGNADETEVKINGDLVEAVMTLRVQKSDCDRKHNPILKIHPFLKIHLVL